MVLGKVDGAMDFCDSNIYSRVLLIPVNCYYFTVEFLINSTTNSKKTCTVLHCYKKQNCIVKRKFSKSSHKNPTGVQIHESKLSPNKRAIFPFSMPWKDNRKVNFLLSACEEGVEEKPWFEL